MVIPLSFDQSQAPPAYTQVQDARSRDGVTLHKYTPAGTARTGSVASVEFVSFPARLDKSLSLQVEQAEYFADRCDLTLWSPHGPTHASSASSETDQDTLQNRHMSYDPPQSSGASTISSMIDYPGESTVALLPSGVPSRSIQSHYPSASSSKEKMLPLAVSFISSDRPASALTDFTLQGATAPRANNSSSSSSTSQGWEWSVQLARLDHETFSSAPIPQSDDSTKSFPRPCVSHVIRKSSSSQVFEIVQQDTQDESPSICRTAKFTKGLFKDRFSILAPEGVETREGEQKVKAWVWKGSIHSTFKLREAAKDGDKTVMAAIFFGQVKPRLEIYTACPDALLAIATAYPIIKTRRDIYAKSFTNQDTLDRLAREAKVDPLEASLFRKSS